MSRRKSSSSFFILHLNFYLSSSVDQREMHNFLVLLYTVPTIDSTWKCPHMKTFNYYHLIQLYSGLFLNWMLIKENRQYNYVLLQIILKKKFSVCWFKNMGKLSVFMNLFQGKLHFFLNGNGCFSAIKPQFFPRDTNHGGAARPRYARVAITSEIWAITSKIFKLSLFTTYFNS